MSSSIENTGIPLTHARALHHDTPKLQNIAEALPERFGDFQAVMAKIEKQRHGLAPEEIVRQLASQSATKAQNVFRNGGKVVAVQYENGGVMYPQGGDVGGAIEAGKQAEALGLSGQQHTDYVAEHMTNRLKAFYGAGLDVQTYDAASAPSQGQLHNEIFGAATQKPSSLFSGSFDAQTLQMMDNMLADLQRR